MDYLGITPEFSWENQFSQDVSSDGFGNAFAYITSEPILSLNPINRTLEMPPYCCSSLDKAIANLLQRELRVAKARKRMIHVNQHVPSFIIID